MTTGCGARIIVAMIGAQVRRHQVAWSPPAITTPRSARQPRGGELRRRPQRRTMIERRSDNCHAAAAAAPSTNNGKSIRSVVTKPMSAATITPKPNQTSAKPSTCSALARSRRARSERCMTSGTPNAATGNIMPAAIKPVSNVVWIDSSAASTDGSCPCAATPMTVATPSATVMSWTVGARSVWIGTRPRPTCVARLTVLSCTGRAAPNTAHVARRRRPMQRSPRSARCRANRRGARYRTSVSGARLWRSGRQARTG